MQAIREWAMTLCFAVVSCSVLQIVMPKSNLTKIFRLVVALFFLLCLLRPLLSLPRDSTFSWSEFVAENSGDTAKQVEDLNEDYAYRQAGENIKKTIEDKLQVLAVIPKRTEVTVGQNAQTEEFYLEVTLTLEEKDLSKEGQIRALMKKELDLEVTLIGQQEG